MLRRLRSNTKFRPNVTQLGPISLQPSRGSPSPSAEHRKLRLKVFLFLPAPIGPAVCFFYHARPAWFLLPQQHTNKYEALPVGFGRFGHEWFGHLIRTIRPPILTRPWWFGHAIRTIRPYYSDSAISFERFGHLFWLDHDDSAMPFERFGHLFWLSHDDSAMPFGRFGHTIRIRPWWFGRPIRTIRPYYSDSAISFGIFGHLF